MEKSKNINQADSQSLVSIVHVASSIGGPAGVGAQLPESAVIDYTAAASSKDQGAHATDNPISNSSTPIPFHRSNFANDSLLNRQAVTPLPNRGSITPDPKQDRSKSPTRPRILLQDSFQLSKDHFNKSVRFDAKKVLDGNTSSLRTQEDFWSTSVVNFNNQIIKMSDNDKNLVRELQQRLIRQREALQSKNVLFEAIQKNFVILQTMCEHQKRSNDLLARQNVKLKSSYDVNLKELTDLRGVYKKAVSELQFLRDKNAAFAEADADRQELLHKMEDLEREVEKQKAELEESEFQLRVLRHGTRRPPRQHQGRRRARRRRRQSGDRGHRLGDRAPQRQRNEHKSHQPRIRHGRHAAGPGVVERAGRPH